MAWGAALHGLRCDRRAERRRCPRALLQGSLAAALVAAGCARAPRGDAHAADGSAERAEAGASSPQIAHLDRFEFQQVHMGMLCRVVCYAPGQQEATDAASHAFSAISRIDALASDYRRNSELNRFVALAGSGPVVVEPEFAALLGLSRSIAQATDGLFDPTVGPLVQLWRAARRSGELPPPEQLRDAKRLVGWERLAVDERGSTASLADVGMRVDMGGIAQGLAADEALAALRARGVGRALVDISGDIAAGLPPPGHSAWRVEVRLDERQGEPMVVALAGMSLSTSGDAAQFVEVQGVRYSHIVDPRTGLGGQRAAGVCVVAPNGAWADALATAMCVAADESALRQMRERASAALGAGVEYIGRWQDTGGATATVRSPGFDALLADGHEAGAAR